MTGDDLQKNPKGPRRTRLKADERKSQIVEVAVELIAQFGVAGTRVTRIADGVGITHSALYAHFTNRQEIMLAALDAAFDRIFADDGTFQDEDALERLRKMMHHQNTRFATPQQNTVGRLFEYFAASSDEVLRDALRARATQANRRLAAIIDEAKCQGTIRQSVDSEQVAWMLEACAWAGDRADTLDIELFRQEAVTARMADLILDAVVEEDRRTTCAGG